MITTKAEAAVQLAVERARMQTDPSFRVTQRCFDWTRVNHLIHLLAEVEKLPTGDYVEVGVLWGLSLKIIHKGMNQSCKLYGFDTFNGFDQRDLDIERTHRLNHPFRTGATAYGFLTGNSDPLTLVRNFLGNPPNLYLVQGWVPESLQPYREIDWRFVHINVDLYEPTLRTMELLWPNLTPGGVMLVHPYGLADFATSVAVDEFCSREQLKFDVLDDHFHSALLRKPKSESG